MSSSWESTSLGKCENNINLQDFKLKAPKVINIPTDITKTE